MKILFLTRYTRLGASSRYRFWQYVPLFEQAGHAVSVVPLLDDGYLRGLYQRGRRGWHWLVAGYARRLWNVPKIRNIDVVVCEQEAFPFLPIAFENIVRKRSARFLVDYDDAAYIRYERWPLLRRKIPRVMAVAYAVVVGNDYLARYSRQFTPRVVVIPSVVNLANYPTPQEAPASRTVRVVWIGTPITAHLLNSLLPVMAELQKKHPGLIFRFIGACSGFSSNGLRAEVLEWTEETEGEMLAQCDIGIMPLPDTEFARGKCGLKLIQYMASGLPVVASPVGANREIVEENQNGLFATSKDEWFATLNRLIENPELRKQMGQTGRAKVAAHYTLEQGFAKWLSLIEEASESIQLASQHPRFQKAC